MKKYFITLLCGGVIMYLLFTIRGTFAQEDNVIVIKDISDAFTSAGILILCCGALVFISNQGMFNMISYSFKKVAFSFRKDHTKRMNKLYHEYNREQQETPASMAHLFVVGSILLLIGTVFVFVYYNMK